MYSQICIFIHILIKLISFLFELLTFNWVCITVIIKWEGNEVSVSSQVHSHIDMGRVEGGLVCPPMRHTMAITTQLTLSIYIQLCVHADIHTHVHTQTVGKGVKRLFANPFYWSCDFDSYTCCRTCEIRQEEERFLDMSWLMPIS